MMSKYAGVIASLALVAGGIYSLSLGHELAGGAIIVVGLICSFFSIAEM